MDKRIIEDRIVKNDTRVEIHQHLVGHPNTYYIYRRSYKGNVVCVHTNKKYAALMAQVKLKFGKE